MKISLTFDNGPHPVVTPQVLDVLAASGTPASFFVIGRLLTPETLPIVRRARDEGHAVGNHTFNHAKPFAELQPPLDPVEEIERAQAALGELGEERLFRPTAGGETPDARLMTPAAYQRLIDGGYSCVLWNNVPRDRANIDGWPEVALAEARRSDWSVVVIHDMDTGAMAHLGRFIAAARAAGGEFVRGFPDACTPIRRGRPTWSMDHLTSAGAAAA
jgi:peptidoglycan/xylan/chitin deacetylase (PgdA/CDA1 family)